MDQSLLDFQDDVHEDFDLSVLADCDPHEILNNNGCIRLCTAVGSVSLDDYSNMAAPVSSAVIEPQAAASKKKTHKRAVSCTTSMVTAPLSDQYHSQINLAHSLNDLSSWDNSSNLTLGIAFDSTLSSASNTSSSYTLNTTTPFSHTAFNFSDLKTLTSVPQTASNLHETTLSPVPNTAASDPSFNSTHTEVRRAASKLYEATASPVPNTAVSNHSFNATPSPVPNTAVSNLSFNATPSPVPNTASNFSFSTASTPVAHVTSGQNLTCTSLTKLAPKPVLAQSPVITLVTQTSQADPDQAAVITVVNTTPQLDQYQAQCSEDVPSTQKGGKRKSSQHRKAEKRYRERIKQGMDDLSSYTGITNPKASKSVILQNALSYIRSLKINIARLQNEKKLLAENLKN